MVASSIFSSSAGFEPVSKVSDEGMYRLEAGDPCVDYLQYADSADMYIKRGEWDKAEKAIVSALRSEPANPANPLLLTNLGIVRNHLGEYDRAIESFDIALSRFPNSTVALTGRAESYIAIEETAKALGDLNRAIDVDSTLSLPLTMKGYLLLKLNRPAAALETFDRLVSLEPKNNLALAGRADSYAGLGRNREAVEAYKEALAVEERPEWRLRCGLLLLELDDLEGAAEQARQSIAANPRDGNIYILMALLHRRRYESHEATIAEKMARDLDADPELMSVYLDK